MGKKGSLSDSECGAVVGVRLAGFKILQTFKYSRRSGFRRRSRNKEGAAVVWIKSLAGVRGERAERFEIKESQQHLISASLRGQHDEP